MGIIYPTVVVVIYIVTRYMLLVSRVDLQYVFSNSLLVQDSSYYQFSASLDQIHILYRILVHIMLVQLAFFQ